MLLLIALAVALQDPDPTLPAQATAVASAEGRGVQIYRCEAQPESQNKTYQWVFQSPQATLLDSVNHQPVGTHSAGPTWVWRDGSSVTGKVLAKATAPVVNAIPWLLLEAHPVAGSETGILSRITFIRRSDTQGGTAPETGCDAKNAGTVVQVPYVATYTFYRPAV